MLGCNPTKRKTPLSSGKTGDDNIKINDKNTYHLLPSFE